MLPYRLDHLQRQRYAVPDGPQGLTQSPDRMPDLQVSGPSTEHTWTELTKTRIRKIKCDEGRPACDRCTSTGRKCDGYATNLQPSLTWYRPNRMFQSLDQPAEGRALQFFCETAGPFLAGPLDSYFWTHLVLQFSGFEPAVRHSVVAISSLYEDFYCQGHPSRRLQDDTFALYHYNLAIESLRRLDNEPLILLVCVLFVCIEFLQGNRDAAIQHCRHGLIILDRIGVTYPWTLNHLSPIFRRLSIFPLYFGVDADNVPGLAGLGAPIPTRFVSLSEAQHHMDAIIYRASRLVRRGDVYRCGHLFGHPVPPDQLDAQQGLQQSISEWHSSFGDLKRRRVAREDQDPAYCNLLTRSTLPRVWAGAVFDPNEVYYDQYMEDLRSVIDRAVHQGQNIPGARDCLSRPRFSFEVGFVPFVIFAVCKCRDLATRLRGLRWLRESGDTRENMWEPSRMYYTCRRLVEIEHDIVLDDEEQPVGPVVWDTLPLEEMRVKDFASSPHVGVQTDANGLQTWGSMANYVMRTAEGVVWIREEFLAKPAPVLQGSVDRPV
jgi:hypothetical protein